MSIWVAVRGTVMAAPDEVETDDEPVAAFLLLDAQVGAYRDQLLDLEQAPACEVLLRGKTATTALRELTAGDPIVALGLLKVVLPLGVANEANLVSVSIEAYSIGRDLAGE
jgi:hypothetical protein